MAPTTRLIVPAVSHSPANQNFRLRRRLHAIDGALAHPSTRSASRLTGLTETGLSAKTYGYDNANRLTSLTIGAAPPTTYTYDANGNRTSLTDPSSNVTTYNYPGTSNQLTSLSGYVAETLSYDAAGNETGDGTNTYAYNARGRMSSVTVGGVATNYGVNGLGQRVTKSGTGVGGGGTNIYVYDEQNHLLGEYNSTGQRIQETVYLNDDPVTVMTGTGTPTFYALSPDWQSTPHVIANSAGTFAWTWDRLGFGDNAPNTNPGGLGTFTYNPRFPGQLSDVESGLSNNMARDYNPVFGRYVESDPIGLWGGINTYGYVAAKPLRYTDARGLDATCGWDPNDPKVHCPSASAKKSGSPPPQSGVGTRTDPTSLCIPASSGSTALGGCSNPLSSIAGPVPLGSNADISTGPPFAFYPDIGNDLASAYEFVGDVALDQLTGYPFEEFTPFGYINVPMTYLQVTNTTQGMNGFENRTAGFNNNSSTDPSNRPFTVNDPTDLPPDPQ